MEAVGIGVVDLEVQGRRLRAGQGGGYGRSDSGQVDDFTGDGGHGGSPWRQQCAVDG
ncbi:hypothetical protein D3C71_1922850 [compost metagenome]